MSIISHLLMMMLLSSTMSLLIFCLLDLSFSNRGMLKFQTISNPFWMVQSYDPWKERHKWVPHHIWFSAIGQKESTKWFKTKQNKQTKKHLSNSIGKESLSSRWYWNIWISYWKKIYEPLLYLKQFQKKLISDHKPRVKTKTSLLQKT